MTTPSTFANSTAYANLQIGKLLALTYTPPTDNHDGLGTSYATLSMMLDDGRVASGVGQQYGYWVLSPQPYLDSSNGHPTVEKYFVEVVATSRVDTSHVDDYGLFVTSFRDDPSMGVVRLVDVNEGSLSSGGGLYDDRTINYLFIAAAIAVTWGAASYLAADGVAVAGADTAVPLLATSDIAAPVLYETAGVSAELATTDLTVTSVGAGEFSAATFPAATATATVGAGTVTSALGSAAGTLQATAGVIAAAGSVASAVSRLGGSRASAGSNNVGRAAPSAGVANRTPAPVASHVQSMLVIGLAAAAALYFGMQ